MKVVIPLAGKGTRLLPVTKHVPKPLIKVAGRPVMDYVMDTVDSLDVEELIIITGHLKDHVEEYVRSHYRQPARFIEQQVQDGTAGAVGLAEPFVDGPVLIIFVDTLFDADLTQIARTVCRRHHLGQGSGGLPALRCDRHGSRRIHGAHRREAVGTDIPACKHRSVLYAGLEDALRRNCLDQEPAKGAKRVLPDRCVSVHDRPR